MFSVGEAVVYRHHVCRIVSIREAYYEGRDYYELEAIFEKSLKLFVAIDEAKPPAMRSVMTADEALALIDSVDSIDSIDGEALAQGTDTPTLLDRRIREEYTRRLNTCEPKQLLPIMRFARERSKKRSEVGRNATATDKKYFELAENLLCNELSLSLGIDREAVPAFLQDRFEKATA